MAEERKHTPGPWTLDRLGKVRCAADDGQGFIADPGDGRYYNSIPRDETISRANARLIAAAPDLLAALEWAVAQIESTHSGTWRTYDADFAKARAAIKRATEG